MYRANTVEPLIKGLPILRTQYIKPPYYGQDFLPQTIDFNLRIKETSLLRTIEDNNSWSQNVLYLEIPLYNTAGSLGMRLALASLKRIDKMTIWTLFFFFFFAGIS